MKKSAAYTLRRHGKNYPAPDLETIRQWISEGRVVGSDLIYDVQEGQWHCLREWPFLRDEFLSASDKPRPPVGPPTVYWVHREGESFAADGLDTLLKWAQAGRLS